MAFGHVTFATRTNGDRNAFFSADGVKDTVLSDQTWANIFIYSGARPTKLSRLRIDGADFINCRHRQFVFAICGLVNDGSVPSLSNAFLLPSLGSVRFVQRDQGSTFIAGVNDHKIFVHNRRRPSGVVFDVVSAKRLPLLLPVMTESNDAR